MHTSTHNESNSENGTEFSRLASSWANAITSTNIRLWEYIEHLRTHPKVKQAIESIKVDGANGTYIASAFSDMLYCIQAGKERKISPAIVIEIANNFNNWVNLGESSKIIGSYLTDPDRLHYLTSRSIPPHTKDLPVKLLSAITGLLCTISLARPKAAVSAINQVITEASTTDFILDPLISALRLFPQRNSITSYTVLSVSKSLNDLLRENPDSTTLIGHSLEDLKSLNSAIKLTRKFNTSPFNKIKTASVLYRLCGRQLPTYKRMFEQAHGNNMQVALDVLMEDKELLGMHLDQQRRIIKDLFTVLPFLRPEQNRDWKRDVDIITVASKIIPILISGNETELYQIALTKILSSNADSKYSADEAAKLIKAAQQIADLVCEITWMPDKSNELLEYIFDNCIKGKAAEYSRQGRGPKKFNATRLATELRLYSPSDSTRNVHVLSQAFKLIADSSFLSNCPEHVSSGLLAQFIYSNTDTNHNLVYASELFDTLLNRKWDVLSFSGLVSLLSFPIGPHFSGGYGASLVTKMIEQLDRQREGLTTDELSGLRQIVEACQSDLYSVATHFCDIASKLSSGPERSAQLNKIAEEILKAKESDQAAHSNLI